MEHRDLVIKITALLKAQGKSKAEFGRELNRYLREKRSDSAGSRISVYRWLLQTHKPRPEVRRAMSSWYRDNK